MLAALASPFSDISLKCLWSLTTGVGVIARHVAEGVGVGVADLGVGLLPIGVGLWRTLAGAVTVNVAGDGVGRWSNGTKSSPKGDFNVDTGVVSVIHLRYI